MRYATGAIAAAALQLEFRPGEPARSRLQRAVAAVSSLERADLVVLPELWDVGYFAFGSYREAASELGAGPVAELAAVVGERVVVAGSVVERSPAGLHNTVAVLGPGGELLGSYRKMHLFRHRSREGDLLVPGDREVVVETPLGRIGLATCFDLRFPEQFLRMRDAGAELFVVPAAWPAARAAHWDLLLRARALDTQSPLVACNGTGRSEDVDLAGRSAIVDHEGVALACAGLEAGWVRAVVDLAAARRWRAEFPLFEPGAVASP